MIRSTLLLCAEKAMRDADNDNLSVFNILDDVIAAGFPITLNRLSIVNFFSREDGDPEKVAVELNIFNNDQLIGEYQVKIDFRGRLKTRAIIQFGSFELAGPGITRFVIMDNERKQLSDYSICLIERTQNTYIA
ncbi:MAG: hypothetical protein P0Y53_21870 [Candidatus Pseudobacter hemicellulosilyticus]|uniref:Uncharacterized protein n=1 Tax=Candidatus Pseudobacter hemicellulosilyticus TaxID=3121375 RepID=A0AAJ5WQN8_9BACT|nr:MAG: hypothetical protein P0Y53_21870 [Pseudobacter sp.]